MRARGAHNAAFRSSKCETGAWVRAFALMVKSGGHALSGPRNRLHAWIFRSSVEFRKTSDAPGKTKKERGDSST